MYRITSQQALLYIYTYVCVCVCQYCCGPFARMHRQSGRLVLQLQKGCEARVGQVSGDYLAMTRLPTCLDWQPRILGEI